MSYTKEGKNFEKIIGIRSIKSLFFNFEFLKNTILGQKVILYNPKLPRNINISFNEQTCFYKCKMCPFSLNKTREMYKEKSEMSFETLENLVSSIPNDSFYSFDISAIGETLLFKPLPEFISYMKKKKPLVNTIISTNGLLLTEDMMYELVNSGLDTIQFSLYAADAKDYEWICAGKQYDKVCENIKMAAEIKKELRSEKPFLQVFMMGIKEFEPKFKPFVDHWSKIVDHAFIRPLYNTGMKIDDLTPLFNKTKTSDRYPCIVPWYSTAIRSNGDVLGCYLFHFYDREHKFGNINENSLKEIWNNKNFKEFREMQINKKWDENPICANCDLWDAYTNIWDKKEKKFIFKKKFGDIFIHSGEYRGG